MRPIFRLSSLFLFVMINLSTSFGQAPDWSSVTMAGGTGNDRGTCVAVDAAGNSYVAGYFYEEATFGSITITSSLYKELFVAKMSLDGAWLWAVNAGGSNHSEITSIALDALGNAYVTGDYHGSPDFGGHSLTSYAYTVDIFIAKISSSGEWQWAVSAGGGSDSEKGYDLALDGGGNIYVTGYFQETASFGTTTLTSNGNSDVFIAKLNPSGGWLGALGIGNTDSDYGVAITVDASDNVYVAGSYSGDITLGTTQLNSETDGSTFVTKLDSYLSYQWAKSADGGDINDIITDASGNAYVTGESEQGATFGSISANGAIFIAKMDDSGTWLWATSPTGTYWGVGYGLCIDDETNLYCTGYFEGEINFDSNILLAQSESETLFATKMTASGEWVWATQSFGTGAIEGHGISVNNDQTVSLVGGFYHTVQFESDTYTSAGSRDIFCVTLNDTASFVANFSADATEGVAPVTINFMDQSIGNPSSWQWDFQNDGTIDSYVQNPQWTYTQNGFYTVSLIVSDGVQTSSSVKENYINLHVSIPDDNFREAINNNLGQPSDYYPTISDLHSITGSFSAAGNWISSIEGAQHLVNVTSISVANNQITDLGPLAGLEQLNFIFAEGNHISNISNLFSLPVLIEIDLSDNFIADVSSLLRFPFLSRIFLNNNQIVNISSLSELQYLTYLWLENNHITDISALSNLVEIESVKLAGNGISDIAPLLDNTGLGEGDNLLLYNEFLPENNPLSHEAFQVHYDLLNARGLNYLTFPPEANNVSPCYPTPTRHADDILSTVLLEWRGNYANENTMHELWLGTSPDEMYSLGFISATNDTIFSFQPTLLPNTNYWWKVRATTTSDTVWSGLWHFKTESVGIPPTANFSADLFSGESPLLVTFSDLSEGDIETWAWDFENDGTIDSYEQNPQHQYAEVGHYSVSLTVTNPDGSDTELKEAYITITPPNITFTVKLDGTGDYTSIQSAIDGVSDGQIIVVYPGTYYENINFNGKAIIVESLFSSSQIAATIDETIINGGGSGNVVRINSGEGSETKLIGFTITNGSSSNTGGGIMMYGTSPTISHCKIVGNNATNYGGGIACLQNSNPVLQYLEILNNTSNEGGGIDVYLSNPTLKNILLSNNIVTSTGGGIALSDCSELSIEHLTITENVAQWGGGVFLTSSELTISNSILWDNTPQEIYFNGYYDPNQVGIAYSDIDGGENGIVVQNGTLDMGDGWINVHPFFNDGYRLTEWSPCIDTGDPDSPLDPDNTRADMGAFYFDPDYVSIDSELDKIESFRVLQNYPNPFNPRTMISYSLPDQLIVSLIIYDVQGKVVQTYGPEMKPAGQYEQVWNGYDFSGASIETGLYFAHLTAGPHTETIKMLYLK